MNRENRILTISYMNIHGQSNIPTVKQLQIQDFIKLNKIDILHMQEVEISEETFSGCDLISSSFNIISNNSENQYGTATLIRNDLDFKNVRCDTAGRAIVFDIGCASFGNFYLQSGTDGTSRNCREIFCSEIIPNLLSNSQSSGCYGGDFNMIIDKNKIDAATNPDSKISPTFKRLVKTFNWSDSFRAINPTDLQFSRYYSNTRGEGASRIDRCYHTGDIEVIAASYLPLAFSDHHAHVVTLCLPDPFSRLICPRAKPLFRIKAEVVQDSVFKASLTEAMTCWQSVRSFGMDVLTWWELLVKPGIRKLAQKRSREMTKLRQEELNLLRLRQSYLNRKLMLGDRSRLGELKAVHGNIENWYKKESNKVKHQTKVSEYQTSEKVSIYHHELHKKQIMRSSILKLETPTGIIEGHSACANFLEQTVSDLLLHPALLDQVAQDALLTEVDVVFTEADKKEVLETLADSNLHTAPGTNGLISY